MKHRFAYIDIAKGLMISLLIFHHLPQVAKQYCDIQSNTLVFLDSLQVFYASFFMQAFFFITGYCSNFNKPFKQFLIADIKTILIPAYVFTNLFRLLDGLIYWHDFELSLFLEFLKNGGDYWFLSSMFVAKILFYFAHKVSLEKFLYYVFFILCLYLGIYKTAHMRTTYWALTHTLTMFIFLQLGYDCKKKDILSNKNLSNIISLLFFLVVLTLYIIGVHIPTLTFIMNIDTFEIPLFLFLTITGTITILNIGRLIDKNRIIEYIGRNTLSIYCIHVFLLILLQNIYIYIYGKPEGILESIIFYIVIGIITLSMSLFGVWLLNTKYLKWTIGRI